MQSTRRLFYFLAVSLAGPAAMAESLSHTGVSAANLGVLPVPSTNSLLAPENIVGSSLIDFGADYSWGRRETLFVSLRDPVIWGTGDGDRADGQSPIDARIVFPGTLRQGLTDQIAVTACCVGLVKLEVFDVDGFLLDFRNAEMFTGIVSLEINRSFRPFPEIAAYRVSKVGPNTNFLTVERASFTTPIDANPVPEPSSLAVAVPILGILFLASFGRQKPRA